MRGAGRDSGAGTPAAALPSGLPLWAASGTSVPASQLLLQFLSHGFLLAVDEPDAHRRLELVDIQDCLQQGLSVLALVLNCASALIIASPRNLDGEARDVFCFCEPPDARHTLGRRPWLRWKTNPNYSP